MLKMFISSNPGVWEIGGYRGNHTPLQFSLICSLLELFQKYECAPSLILGTHLWHLGA